MTEGNPMDDARVVPAEQLESQTSDYFSAERSAHLVNDRMGKHVSRRLAHIMRNLVEHLHAFAKDVNLTWAEWEEGIDFLTRTGRMCSDERHEFILLSDALGFSMLVDALNNSRPEGATENTVLGPFYVADAPIRAMGDNIALDGRGESCLFEGAVQDLQGRPVAGACVDVWCDNADGLYDVQQPDIQPRWNNRGRFITGEDGRYEFLGIKPISYRIPADGPVGQLLDRLERHPYRPAHMHYLITAPGFQKVVTHIFVDGDQYLSSDAVFGVKSSLIARFERVEDATNQWHSQFDFVLTPT